MRKSLLTCVLGGVLMVPGTGEAGKPTEAPDNWKPAAPQSEPASPSRLRTWLRSVFSKRGDKNKPESANGDKKQRDEVSDLELANRARAALYQDHQLASYNLEVSVQDGVATVSGPVPSDSFRQRAVATLKRLGGIKEVRDQLRIRSTPITSNPRTRIFPPVDDPTHAPTQIPPDKTMPREISPKATPLLGKPVGRSRCGEDPTGWVAEGTSQRTVTRVSAHPPTLGTDLQCGITENRGATRGELTFAFAVHRVMRANPRFQAVFLETDGRRVQLSGSVGSDADRDDLVRALQAVDGVNEVIATDLQVEAP